MSVEPLTREERDGVLRFGVLHTERSRMFFRYERTVQIAEEERDALKLRVRELEQAVSEALEACP